MRAKVTKYLIAKGCAWREEGVLDLTPVTMADVTYTLGRYGFVQGRIRKNVWSNGAEMFLLNDTDGFLQTLDL